MIFKVKFIFFVLYCLKIVTVELHLENDFYKNIAKIISTNMTPLVNDTLLLPCSLNTSLNYIRWRHNDIQIVDSRHPEIVPSDRFYLWNNGSLQVSQVEAGDTGDYYCEIISNTNLTACLYSVEVQIPPSVHLNPNGVIELPIGAIFELTCVANGVPQPLITWKLKGKPIEKYNIGNRQSHIIEIKSTNMAGPIECFASNGVGQPAVSGAYLHVLFPPEIHVEQAVIYTKIGMRVQLKCIVESAPSAIVEWIHHGLILPINSDTSSSEIEIQTNRSIEHYITKSIHILTIKKVFDSDMGEYKCRAQNNIGYSSNKIELTGRPMPCVFKILPGIPSSTSHVLVWQTESLLPILEFKLKFRQIPSGNIAKQAPVDSSWRKLTIPADLTDGPIYITSYSLHGLQPASIFEVSVVARNSYGWSENSKIIRFATGGEVELPNYSTESELRDNSEENKDFQNTTVGFDVHIAKIMRGSVQMNKCTSFSISVILINILLAHFCINTIIYLVK